MNSLFMTCKAPVWIRTRKQSLVALGVIVLFLLTSCSLLAQTQQGAIQGGVFDQSGGAIVSANVVVTDVPRGIARTFATDSAGQYVALNLTPGTYTVRCEANGFQRLEEANIQVEVGHTVRVDLTLQPGAQTQTITVTEQAAAIDTTDAVLGSTIGNRPVSSLPTNGRNFLKMLDLQPGAVRQLGGGEGIGNTNVTSYDGLRAGDNLWIVEGLPEFTRAGSDVIGSSSLLSVDAIQEMNVEINPKAEYGWKDGAAINIGIKSGTNDLHGSAFAFGRDTSLDAANYFTHAPISMAMEQYGGTLGGRIIKDKLFWFLSYENQTYQVGNGITPTMPSDVAMGSLDPSNQLSMVDACNAIGRGKVNPLSAELAGLPAGSCVPQAPSSTFENVFPFNPTTNITLNPGFVSTSSVPSGIAKVDYHISDHHHLSGAVFISRNPENIAGTTQTEPQWSTLYSQSTESASGTWTWTPNSTWVNEFRSGFMRQLLIRTAGDGNLLPGNPWPNGYSMNTGVTNPKYGGFPQVQIGGFNGTLGEQNGATSPSVNGPTNNINILDHVSFLRGKHAWKFGFEFVDYPEGNATYKNASGTVKFTNLQTFLQGAPASGSIAIGDPTQYVVNQDYAVFAQDDWRVSRKVMLNLGLRWEYNTRPTEQNNYMGNFYPDANPATTPAIQQTGGKFPQLFKPDYRQFSPRLGTAWDVTGSGKTVVRAAAGVLYEMLSIGNTVNVTPPFGANFPSLGINNSGTAISAHTLDNFSVTASQFNWNTTGATIFPSGVNTINGVTYTGVTCTATTPCAVIAVDQNLRTPFTAEWNADVQHAVTNNLTIDVAYVGNHAFNVFSRNDANQPAFGFGWNNPVSTGPFNGLSPAAYCVANPGTVGNCLTNKTVLAAVTANEVAGRPYSQFPYLNYITLQRNQWHSKYNGLQISVRERASHGLTFLASYTHDSALDFSNGGGWAGPYSQDAYDVSHDYGPGGLDVKNRFTFQTTYNLPGRKVPGQLLEGWAVNGVVLMQGGIPWYPEDTTSDIQGTGEYADSNSAAAQSWNYSGPASAFTSNPTNITCFGSLAGCTPYTGGTPPQACVTAAQAPYNGNSQLQALALTSLTNLGCFVKGAGVLTPPAYGTFGNAFRGIFHAPPFYNVDFSIFKDWHFRERLTAQFRTEVFNLFNRVDLAVPNVIDPEKGLGFGCSCQTIDAAGGDTVFGAGGARTIQLGLKFIF